MIGNDHAEDTVLIRLKELVLQTTNAYIMVYITGERVERKRKVRKSTAKARAKSREVDLAASPTRDSRLKRASLFMNGRSQAVRLPKEFRFKGDHVFAMKDGDRVVLMPRDDRMERFLAAFGSAPDFPDRDQGAPQERPELDDLFK